MLNIYAVAVFGGFILGFLVGAFNTFVRILDTPPIGKEWIEILLTGIFYGIVVAISLFLLVFTFETVYEKARII